MSTDALKRRLDRLEGNCPPPAGHAADGACPDWSRLNDDEAAFLTRLLAGVPAGSNLDLSTLTDDELDQLEVIVEKACP